MRLFVAVYPAPEAVADLTAALPPADRALRWVPPEQWHVTLAFLGEVGESVLPDLVERLGRAADRTAPMTLGLQGAGAFPKPVRRARTLWCGLAGDVAELTRLAERCVAAARRAGIAVDERRFRAHLTLARARDHEADLTGPVTVLSAYAGPTWTVAEVLLMRSHLGPPVRHEPLQAWSLSGHQA